MTDKTKIGDLKVEVMEARDALRDLQAVLFCTVVPLLLWWLSFLCKFLGVEM